MEDDDNRGSQSSSLQPLVEEAGIEGLFQKIPDAQVSFLEMYTPRYLKQEIEKKDCVYTSSLLFHSEKDCWLCTKPPDHTVLSCNPTCNLQI